MLYPPSKPKRHEKINIQDNKNSQCWLEYNEGKRAWYSTRHANINDYMHTSTKAKEDGHIEDC